jgi:hypothetical protein
MSKDEIDYMFRKATNAVKKLLTNPMIASSSRPLHHFQTEAWSSILNKDICLALKREAIISKRADCNLPLIQIIAHALEMLYYAESEEDHDSDVSAARLHSIVFLPVKKKISAVEKWRKRREAREKGISEKVIEESEKGIEEVSSLELVQSVCKLRHIHFEDLITFKRCVTMHQVRGKEEAYRIAYYLDALVQVLSFKVICVYMFIRI